MYKYTFVALYISLLFAACTSQNGKIQHGDKQYTNHLANESSPYLLQHANNPVDWYPWGEDALNKAKTENKMIIVSVGYAACHWCHVMEHESFEDTLVSKIMNEHFVCIKVDREERPDIDDVYMTACHLASGKSCGWPLNAFALPDGRPVWAGTYFPKDEWTNILNSFKDKWQNNPQEFQNYAEQLTSGIAQNDQVLINTGKQTFNKAVIEKIGKTFLDNIDFRKGGRKGSPKFPMPNNYEFLLNYYHQFQDEKALEAVTVTLDNMANGGIYDHLGGGFARYSVDGIWKVPHFEKMLYDNGQLVSLYSKAYQLTKNPLYKKVVEETLEYINREMTDKTGGFYSSLDADSDGEEGKFYVWTKDEIEAVLTDENERKVFNDYYAVIPRGNWEEGKNILHRKKSTEKILSAHNITESELEDLISMSKSKLFKVRDKRVRPGLDDKILTSWNALMISGYVDAYKAFGNQGYLEAAKKNGAFLVNEMIQKDNRLNRNFKNGKSTINAFLDDYALTISAFTALYEVTFDEKWLYKAKDLTDYTIVHFFDEKSGMFNYTSDIDPPLVARKKELGDNVIPGSNSAIARGLFILGTYLYQSDYIDKARQMMKNMENTIAETGQPNFYSNWCSLYNSIVAPPYEVAIVGDHAAKLRDEMLENFLPNAILLGGKNEGSLELLKDKLQEGETMIYVCQNKVCKFPVKDVSKALTLLE